MTDIKAIIIDDEQDSRESLSSYLTKYCPQVNVAATAENIIVAKKAIDAHKPNLLFLDIEMPHGNAFDLLDQFKVINFEIIFITAFSQYAVKAFKLSAANYLLKPVSIEDLESAVATVEYRLSQKDKMNHIHVLLENMNVQKSQNQKLVLPLMEGFNIVRVSEILYCEAEDNFTCFHFTDGQKQMICRNLKFYEKALSEHGFCRIHRSTLVNLDYVSKYNKGSGGVLTLTNGKELNVSSSKKSQLLTRINTWIT